MFPFMHQLGRLWVINQIRLAHWYYTRRVGFGLGGAESASVQLPRNIRGPVGDVAALLQIPLRDLSDAREVVGMFNYDNPWNRFQPDGDVQTLVDLGSNKGLSTLYWLNRFPGADVHCVEMDAANCAQAKALFATNNRLPNIHQIAIAQTDGPIRYRANVCDTRHRLDAVIKRDEEHCYTQKYVEVPGMTLSTFCSVTGIKKIDLLKVDIEGAEYFLFNSVLTWAHRVRHMLVEIHHNIDETRANAALIRGGVKVVLGDKSGRTEWWCTRG